MGTVSVLLHLPSTSRVGRAPTDKGGRPVRKTKAPEIIIDLNRRCSFCKHKGVVSVVGDTGLCFACALIERGLLRVVAQRLVAKPRG